MRRIMMKFLLFFLYFYDPPHSSSPIPFFHQFLGVGNKEENIAKIAQKLEEK